MNTIEQTRAQEKTTKVIQTLKQQYNVNEFDKYNLYHDLKGLQEIQNVLKSIISDIKDQRDKDEIERYIDNYNEWK